MRLASNYVWTFTTGAAVVVVPPETDFDSPCQCGDGRAAESGSERNLQRGDESADLHHGDVPPSRDRAELRCRGRWPMTRSTSLPPSRLRFRWLASTTYTATVTDGVTNLAGVPLGTTGAPNPWTFTTGTAVVPPPVILGPSISLFGGFGGPAGMTNMGIETVVNGDIGTTGASTLITGFHDTSVMVGGVAECTYTETPLNIGLVNGEIATAPPPPTVGCPNEGTAVTFALATAAGRKL
jgi:hypothetical protein